MSVFYSASENCFYSSEVFSIDSIPAGSVEISKARHDELLDLQSAGQVIVSDDKGAPMVTAPAPSSFHKWNKKQWVITKANQAKLDEEIAIQKKLAAAQDVAILRADCDRDILPLQDAVDLDEATSDEIERLKTLKRLRIALNRWEYPEEIPEL